MTAFSHDPVMRDEIVQAFADVPAGAYVDGTLGGAGHAVAVLESRPDLNLVGIDRDEVALAAARARLEPFGDRVSLAHARFDEMQRVLDELGETGSVSAMLLDLGVSSPQLDVAERGFSYREDGPLDMRMDESSPLTADDIVNTWPEAEISRIIHTFGDERFARRIATAIVAARPISSTVELAEVIRGAIPAATRRKGGHPAKRTFQAIRIAVNDELSQIDTAIRAAISAMVPGARGAVLAYHSGEDRIVKHTITSEETGGCTCPARLPCVCGAEARVAAVSPRRRTPNEQEMERNPRARSAQLRIFERVGPTAIQDAS